MDQAETDCVARHREFRGALQLWLRGIAVLAAVLGLFVAVFSAAQMDSTNEGAIVFAETYGSILSGALTLWIAAAILDALRVIAANSFSSAASPSDKTP